MITIVANFYFLNFSNVEYLIKKGLNFRDKFLKIKD